MKYYNTPAPIAKRFISRSENYTEHTWDKIDNVLDMVLKDMDIQTIKRANQWRRDVLYNAAKKRTKPMKNIPATPLKKKG